LEIVMIAIARAFVSAIVMVLAVVFAVENRQPVQLVWSPFSDPVSVPLFLVGLGSLGIGFIAGAMLLWLRGLSGRLALRRQRRRIEALERDLEATSGTPVKADAGRALLPAMATSESNGLERV
jgi:uncharacterized integral membrane protein